MSGWMPSWFWIATDSRFVTGATVPYLIGGLRVERGTEGLEQNESSGRAEFDALLTSMRDDLSTPDCICIQHCSYVDGYVAAWHPSAPSGRAFIASPGNSERGLYHPHELYQQRIQGWDALLEALWNNHKKWILERRFSREWVVDLNGKRRRDWLRFEQCEADEREEIRRTLANPRERTRWGQTGSASQTRL